MLLYFFPLIAACIGWLFNVLLTRRLFGKTLPEKAPALADMAGRYASEQLLQLDVIAAKLSDPQQLSEVRPFIEGHIDIFLNQKLKEKMPAIAMFIGDKTIATMKSTLMEEIDLLLPGLLGRYLDNLGAKMDIRKTLMTKINNLPEGAVEAFLDRHLAQEKRMLRLYGALAGFVTGLVLMTLALLAA